MAEQEESLFSKLIPSQFHDLDALLSWFDGWGISRALVLWILFLGLLWVLSLEVPNIALFSMGWLAGTAPVWLPICLLIAAFRAWVWYRQGHFIAGRDPVLLEMKIPRDITKSPRAMEQVLSNLWLTSGEVTFLHRAWRGQVRPWFSLEMASFGGELHFYVWTWKGYRRTFESAFYAQYPEVEFHEVEDYAAKFHFDPNIHTCFGTDWILFPVKAKGVGGIERQNAYPFRTYVDFELDQDPKEEFKVDPFAQVLGYMGGIPPNEQVWAQLLITANQERGVLLRKAYDKLYTKLIEEEVHDLRLKSLVDTGGGVKRPLQSWKQTEMIRSMERNMGKYSFEFVGRGIYIVDTTRGSFRSAGYGGTRWLWKPFGNPYYMSYLRPKRWHNAYDYPWQDFHQMRWNLTTRRFLDAYRRRSAFFSPWTTPPNYLSVETLASIWHPPARAVSIPGLERIAATKAEAPSNLPTK